jgi:hypothetical protein
VSAQMCVCCFAPRFIMFMNHVSLIHEYGHRYIYLHKCAVAAIRRSFSLYCCAILLFNKIMEERELFSCAVRGKFLCQVQLGEIEIFSSCEVGSIEDGIFKGIYKRVH